MKNRPQRSRYKPGQAGKSPLHVTIAPDSHGYWYGSVWQRGPLQCLYSTGARVDQREVHTAIKAWVREQGWHRS